MMALGTAPSAHQLPLRAQVRVQVRVQMRRGGGLASCITYIVPNPELEVMSGVTMATGDGVISREVKWQWKKGQSYDNETYHVRVREVGEGGEGGERWLEVSGKVSNVIVTMSLVSMPLFTVWCSLIISLSQQMSAVIGGLLSSSAYSVSVSYTVTVYSASALPPAAHACHDLCCPLHAGVEVRMWL